MTTKKTLYEACLTYIDERLKTVQKTILDIQQSLESETKSSAGDKHETGRAMLQLEREKAGQQLLEIENQKAILQKINPEVKHENVTLGSVVKTTNANYFIAISAGELRIDNTAYYAISVATPIAKLLVSKAKGDPIVFRAQPFTITDVL